MPNTSKTVMISGGAQGIGRATALAFASKGYSVSILDTDKEAGFEAVRLIKQAEGHSMFLCADVGKAESIERWIRLTLEEFGRVDALINNAGIHANAPFLELEAAAFDRVIAVNLRGTMLASQAAARVMKQQGDGGSIVHIASTRGLMSEAGTEAYSASKGGILALTHAMAVSLGTFGIRVNAISPGWIETGPWQKQSRAAAPNHTQRDREQHPVGRVGVPEDIASACLYLTSDAAGFITGQNLVIDGGMTIKMIYE
ncbi:SDR family NAD(P)-dependent oxidoreductase [Paenibacillus senegalensis]|uniref:SDR family NAD(P)-dependent oxidoreductase n=1 Tax=Paenibacillus senegalensis TaxID=1465766 RepID=UPI00028A25EE|nr:glucose 1-dehydrogenase [Paenibacillus senegalensis]